MTTKDCLAEYLGWKKASRAPTAKIYAQLLHAFIDFIPCKKMEEVGIKDVSDFQSHLAETRKSATIALYTTAIRDFVRYTNYLGKTHIVPRMIPSIQIEENPHKTLTLEEFKRIDSAIMEPDKRVLHYFLWDTALRISEVCSLKVSEISLEEKSALVRVKKSRQLGWVFWSNKTNELLRENIAGRSSDKLLFPFTTRTAERYIKEISEKVGIENITPHSYRHGQAHYIASKGGGLMEVSAKLHHVALESSRRYLHLDKEEQRKIANRFF